MLKVVDTNVPLVANKMADHASLKCREACVRFLHKLTREGKIVIDDCRLIINEYRNKLNPSGQPGVGDAFLKWVSTNEFNTDRCDIVPITPIENGTFFEEFPNDPRLKNFDVDDRKFVVVSNAHPDNPEIMEAVDKGFWEHRNILKDNGVIVEFLCEEDIQSY